MCHGKLSHGKLRGLLGGAPAKYVSLENIYLLPAGMYAGQVWGTEFNKQEKLSATHEFFEGHAGC
jgi:hypothetical protein